jgi:His-Xaa-Ser system radical SAM maturase HxsC
MCSQPPKNIDDSDRITEHLRLIDLIHPDTPELGITGGEPTLLKDDLLRIIAHAKDRLPKTSLHLLSNGRLFYYARFAQRLAAIEHHDLIIGIPLYSDLDTVHDYVVQAKGSYVETIIGLHHLARCGVPVELRVVLHQLTVPRLVKIAEFIYRNLPFARHVALMGLEMTGFTLPNKELLWADPWDYQAVLEHATTYLAERGMHVSIYNHQLCTIPPSVWAYARKSISDWKNDYLPACSTCSVREACGGFFSSSVNHRYSQHIHPITLDGSHRSDFLPFSCKGREG